MNPEATNFLAMAVHSQELEGQGECWQVWTSWPQDCSSSSNAVSQWVGAALPLASFGCLEDDSASPSFHCGPTSLGHIASACATWGWFFPRQLVPEVDALEGLRSTVYCLVVRYAFVGSCSCGLLLTIASSWPWLCSWTHSCLAFGLSVWYLFSDSWPWPMAMFLTTLMSCLLACHILNVIPGDHPWLYCWLCYYYLSTTIANMWLFWGLCPGDPTAEKSNV